MKAMMATILVLGLFPVANAGPAVSYSCVGTDRKSGLAVVFDVSFSDSIRDVGYTNQSVTVKEIDWKELETPPVFQMWGANPSNLCQRNGFGEIYMNPADFEMTPHNDTRLADELVSFKSDCLEDLKLDVEGVCFLED